VCFYNTFILSFFQKFVKRIRIFVTGFLFNGKVGFESGLRTFESFYQILGVFPDKAHKSPSKAFSFRENLDKF
jgi:hypothetical protein